MRFVVSVETLILSTLCAYYELLLQTKNLVLAAVRSFSPVMYRELGEMV
jgi:ABC-type polysaccharide/polyol phosphate export permease